MLGELKNLVVRQDERYDRNARDYQARTIAGKIFFLFMHLAPGIFAVVVINTSSVYFPLRDLTGLSDKTFQYVMFILVTYLWHTAYPVVSLMKIDKLSFREAMAFLNLDEVDWRGLFISLPLLFIPYTLLSAPYFRFVEPWLTEKLSSIEMFRIPDHSIFIGDRLYDYPPVLLLFLFIGNFLGEEVYYRGYLMKKCAFLGKHTWWITSVLFALYHLWQIPHTWPLFGPAIFFGLVMILRKNLYVVIILHLILNLWWVGFMESTFGS